MLLDPRWRALPSRGLSRRAFLLAALAAAAPWPRRAAAAQQPNLLLIVADDLGAAHLGCYGAAGARTPHLDALASQSALFEQTWCTQASCSPSRGSIFTGLSPHQHGLVGLNHVGYEVRPDVMTLPLALGRLGYRTGVLGKLHVDQLEPHFEWRGSAWPATLDPNRAATQAQAFMAADDGRPFFLTVGYADPHAHNNGGKWTYLRQIHGYPERPRDPADIVPFPRLAVDTPANRASAADYYNSVERLDVAVGALLAGLGPLAANTHVLFTSDHGPATPFPLGKLSCMQPGLHVPLMMRLADGRGAGRRHQTLTSHVDLMPTLIELGGGALGDELEGRSLLQLLGPDACAAGRHVFAEFTAHEMRHWDPSRAVRGPRYKLIRHLLAAGANLDPDLAARWQDRPPLELYDLQADPEERQNLADDPAHQAALRQLSDTLSQWQLDTNDPLACDDALQAEAELYRDAVLTGQNRYADWELIRYLPLSR